MERSSIPIRMGLKSNTLEEKRSLTDRQTDRQGTGATVILTLKKRLLAKVTVDCWYSC